MNKLHQVYVYFGLFFMLSGCGSIVDDQTEQKSESEASLESYQTIPSLVPVADYTGEEYELRDADPDMEISAEMEAEIETAVKEFFQENYKTEVKMNRYFKGDGYVRAVVESVGDPLFYTEVNVGLEKDGDLVTGVTGVGAREGEVEQAITSGLIAMVREEQFAELDKLLEEFVEEFPVQGLRSEVVTNVVGNRYSTPYYFVSHGDFEVLDLMTPYLEEFPIDKMSWKERYGALQYDPEFFFIAINLFMDEEGAQPNEELVEELTERIKASDTLPRGGYSVLLHDSNIIGMVGSGKKENSVSEGVLEKIIKE